MHISITHSLTEKEALTRIKKLITRSKKEYASMVTDVHESWKENTGTFSFAVRGYTLSGTILVKGKEVMLDGELPFTLRFMKGKIERTIREQARELLR